MQMHTICWQDITNEENNVNSVADKPTLVLRAYWKDEKL